LVVHLKTTAFTLSLQCEGAAHAAIYESLAKKQSYELSRSILSGCGLVDKSRFPPLWLALLLVVRVEVHLMRTEDKRSLGLCRLAMGGVVML